MRNRREFLKDAAAGAVVLGAGTKLAAEGTTAAKSRVVVAKDAALHDANGVMDEKRVPALLDRAIAAYTGQSKPLAAWKQILARGGGEGKVIGLKVNGLGSKGIATHPALVMAVAERLQQAGIKPGNIIVFDMNTNFLQACGLTINSGDRSRMRVIPNDAAEFEAEVACGSSKAHFTKTLTQDCAMVINLPILKDHSGAGLTFAMKNMYGVIKHPDLLHGNHCNPGVADLNALPVVRQKVNFIIGDAMSSVYDGGPGFRPERLWYPNTLLVGEDRVAVDYLAWQMIERKRKEAGMKSLEEAGRAPRYIATAADAAHKLGTCDPARISVKEV
ncbi:MAG: DUF362 domain-containing protein [Acidobacteriaceae bacterium]|nr:DUF362 domain-containing protein [Acidobacteriaceae bacterium]